MTQPSRFLGPTGPLAWPAPGVDWFAAGSNPMLGMPFDALRWAYASGVHSGVIPRSLLASHRLERALVAAEQLALGPLARRV